MPETAVPEMSGGAGMIELAEHQATALIRVRGDIDAGMAPSLRDALAWAVDNHSVVVLDLSAAPVLDSSGLGVLIRAHQRARTRETTLCLAAPSRFILTVLHTMHADSVFPVFDDCPSAWAWIRSGAGLAASGVRS